jgi:hypothetical protein
LSDETIPFSLPRFGVSPVDPFVTTVESGRQERFDSVKTLADLGQL